MYNCIIICNIMYICIPCGHKQSACLFPCQYPDTTCLSISIWVAWSLGFVDLLTSSFNL